MEVDRPKWTTLSKHVNHKPELPHPTQLEQVCRGTVGMADAAVGGVRTLGACAPYTSHPVVCGATLLSHVLARGSVSAAGYSEGGRE